MYFLTRDVHDALSVATPLELVAAAITEYVHSLSLMVCSPSLGGVRASLDGMITRFARTRLFEQMWNVGGCLWAHGMVCRCFGSLPYHLQMLSSGQLLQGRGVVGQGGITISFS